MAIFGNLDLDSTVQTDERIRLDASESYVTQDEAAISLVEIEPEASAGFVTVSGASITSDMWHLDWKYSTAGTKVVTLRITTDGSPVTLTKNVEVVTAADDGLFASDEDMEKFEPDIQKWIPAGRSTWNFVHRKVQDKILTQIYKSRILATDGTKLTKAEVIDKAEVREWATFMALAIIFNGISNQPDDVFSQKSEMYEKKASQFQEYSLNVLHLDYNKNGQLEPSEKADFRSLNLIRR